MIHSPHDIYPGKLIYIPTNRYWDHIKRTINNFPLDSLPIQKKTELNTPPFCATMVLSGLLILLALSQKIYQVGDTAVLTLFKLNLSQKPIRLNYNTGQRYDFKIIYPSGHTLWMWSKNKSFIEALGSVDLDVGQSILYTETFTFPSNLPAGVYQVLGWDLAKEVQNFKLHLPIYITNYK